MPPAFRSPLLLSDDVVRDHLAREDVVPLLSLFGAHASVLAVINAWDFYSLKHSHYKKLHRI